jgi:hypothetical protein
VPPLPIWHHRRWLLTAVLGCVAILLFSVGQPPARAANRAPVGPPAQLSPRDDTAHQRPAVALDAAGNAVVVWQAGAASPDIYAQLLSATGTPSGPAFRVNSVTAGSQRRPTVAAAAAGGFVVAWDGAGPGDAQGIWARRFNAAGAPLGSDFLVNTTLDGDQLNPAIAMEPGGAFVVAWEGKVPNDPNGVAFRRFTATAFPRDWVDQVPYSVPPPRFSTRGAPRVALASTGALAVAWEQSGFDETTFEEFFTIELRRYDAAGVPLGAASALVTATAGAAVGEPDLAFDSDTGLTVAWARRPLGDAQAVIEVVRLDPTGGQLSPPTTLSSGPLAVRASPRVAIDSADAAVVVWADAGALNGTPLGLAARLISSAGTIQGDLLTPSLPAAAVPLAANRVAVATAGTPLADLLIVWDAPGQNEVSAVYGRAYRAPSVVLTRNGAILREDGPAIDLSVALATIPTSSVQITLAPRDNQLRLAGLPPGAPLTLTISPDVGVQPQVIAVSAPLDDQRSGVRTSVIDVRVASSDPAYQGATARIVVDGTLGAAVTFTVFDDHAPAPSPSPTPNPPPPSPTPTTGPVNAAERTFLPLVGR